MSVSVVGLLSALQFFSWQADALLVHQHFAWHGIERSSIHHFGDFQFRPLGPLEMLRDSEDRSSLVPKKNDLLFSSSVTTFESDHSPSSLPAFLALIFVPFAWGTYAPIVEKVYSLDPRVPGTVFSCAYFAVASLSTMALLFVNNLKDQRTEIVKNAATNEFRTFQYKDIQSSHQGSSSYQKVCSFFDNLNLPTLAGIELGMIVFVGNMLQVLGLETIPADRAGFLMQLTTVFVPLLHSVVNRNMKSMDSRTVIACLIALMGIYVMGIDWSLLPSIGTGIEQGMTLLSPDLTRFVGYVSANSHFSEGDALMVASAFCYSAHVIRIGYWSSQSAPLKLVTSKSFFETIFNMIFLGLALICACQEPETSSSQFLGDASMLGTLNRNELFSFIFDSGREISAFFESVKDHLYDGTISRSAVQTAVAATVWTGLVSTAGVIYAQSFGQQQVGAVRANLIYALQPLFTALFAFLLLGETMGICGFIGGGMLVAAVNLVASHDMRFEENANSTSPESHL
jgi:drug/metabolite transporter (DMT)-like permease